MQTASVSDGRIYIANDPSQPRVGDYRISYRIVPAEEASVVARQSGSDLTGYQTQAGDTILLAERGKVSAAEMFKEAQDHNRVLTWCCAAHAPSSCSLASWSSCGRLW